MSLSGGKSDKTCVATIDYYPKHNKIFLKDIKDKIQSDAETSQDKSLLDILNKPDASLHSISVDSPLGFPNCLTHTCGGIDKCKDKTTKWHWSHYRKVKKRKKNLKLFTPYTERCVERHINYDLEEFFEIPEAFGANKAPLAARSIYLKSKIKKKLIEVFPRLTVSRIGTKFKLPKNELRNYRHSVYGYDSRLSFLQSLIEEDLLFIYDQDLQKLVENLHAFDSMIGALTGYLKYLGQTEKPPKNFPTTEGWIDYPVVNFKF